jgi:TetR/AcrR family transcriptional repressor of nem operon
MARPREFDEEQVLDAAMQCFWNRGYEATSMRDLVEKTGISSASLYNTYGDKRTLFRTALIRYVDDSIGARIRSYEALPPRQAIAAFFEEILARSPADPEGKGCFLVNSALEMAPHDIEFREIIAEVLVRLEGFFARCVRAGQEDGSIDASLGAETAARHLLGVLMGIRVLARVKPQRTVLEDVVVPALTMLDPVRDRPAA